MKQISLTVPMDYNALTRASDMLHGLAIDLQKQEPARNNHVTIGEVTEAVTTHLDNKIAELTEETPPAPAAEPSPSLFAENPTEAPKPQEVVNTAPSAEAVASSAHTVDLDKDGLPWDARIHASTKTKLAKTGQWKKKRGVSPELVAEVEAELRAAMAAPAPNAPAEPAPVVDSATTTPTTAETAAPTPPPPAATAAAPTPPPPVTTPDPAPADTQPASPVASGGITTLPELMAASTAAGKTPADMLAAAQKAGLASVALLGARPDLVPTVAAELGLGG